MVSGVLPVVGVPLPLISYGGTSIVSLLIGFGLIMSMQRTNGTFRGFVVRIIQTIIIVASIIGSSIPLANANYAERSEVKAMVKRLAAKGLDPNKVLALMSKRSD